MSTKPYNRKTSPNRTPGKRALAGNPLPAKGQARPASLAAVHQCLVTWDQKSERLAKTIHDGLAQELGALALLLSGTKKRLAGDESGFQQALVQVQRIARLASELAESLHPVTLELTGLGPALLRLLERLERQSGVLVTLLQEGDLAAVPLEQALGIYRLVQTIFDPDGGSPPHFRVGQVLVRHKLNGEIELAVVLPPAGSELPPEPWFTARLVAIHQRAGLLGAQLEWSWGTAAGGLIQMTVRNKS